MVYPIMHVHEHMHVDTNQDCEFYSKGWLSLMNMMETDCIDFVKSCHDY